MFFHNAKNWFPEKLRCLCSDPGRKAFLKLSDTSVPCTKDIRNFFWQFFVDFCVWGRCNKKVRALPYTDTLVNSAELRTRKPHRQIAYHSSSRVADITNSVFEPSNQVLLVWGNYMLGYFGVAFPIPIPLEPPFPLKRMWTRLTGRLQNHGTIKFVPNYYVVRLWLFHLMIPSVVRSFQFRRFNVPSFVRLKFISFCLLFLSSLVFLSTHTLTHTHTSECI